MPHHIQADMSKMLTLSDDVDSEKGACGRYKEETKRESTALSLSMKVVTWRKGACARYTLTKQYV